jgi:hypothetical protein
MMMMVVVVVVTAVLMPNSLFLFESQKIQT